MRLEFHGAAGGVTGSHMVLDADGFRVGIDAGLFQGIEAKRDQADFGYDPRSLNALLLTHAHIDHSGRIPLLVKRGFHGLIYATAATIDLCDILLRDSARLMEEADHNSLHPEQGTTDPLYTEEDVIQATTQFQSVEYDRPVDVDGFSVTFRDAGHILGSAMLELNLGGKRIVFSGDLGRPGAPLIRDPEKVGEADWLVLESTYGNRDHNDRFDMGERLLEIVLETLEHGGNIVIPASAVGRTQEILFKLNPYAEVGKLKGAKCFVDSPMAISAGKIYSRHPECLDEETIEMLKKGDDPFEFPGIRYARTRDESKAINDLKEPHIIISSSGMCTGGRVLHHLIHNLERSESTVLLVGYLAEGTLCRELLNGAKNVSIMGRQLDVKARIESLDGFSAHAGKSEILEWLRAFKKFPGHVFLDHGDPDAAQALAQMIKGEFGAEVIIPKMGESYELD